MSGKTQPAITQRINRSKGDNKDQVKTAETQTPGGLQGDNKDRVKTAQIQTPGGLQGARLIPADLIFEWLMGDNPKLALEMGKAGATLYIYKLAGYQVKASEPEPPNRLPTVTEVCRDPEWWKCRDGGKVTQTKTRPVTWPGFLYAILGMSTQQEVQLCKF